MSDNKLTRRDFLQSGSLMAAGAVSSMLSVAGCVSRFDADRQASQASGRALGGWIRTRL
jgi:hypothetical protein